MKLKTKTVIGTGAFAALLLIAGQNCQPNYFIKATGGDQAQATGGAVDPICTKGQDCAEDLPPIAEFKCKTIVPITLADPLDVPARANDGVCYSLKILNAIANSKSSLSPTMDQSVISRDHEGTGGLPMNTRHPYVLGRSMVRLIMQDRRFIKLSASGVELKPIKVDNFLLVGTFPDNASHSADASFYRSYGTEDSTIPQTNHITLNDEAIELESFGPSGTSTITALDITNFIRPMTIYDLDVRALDCGSIRENSDVYLLFQ